MTDIRSSFDDVADWTERYLELQRGREAGMTLGALLRVYGQLATLRPQPQDLGPPYTIEERQLMVRTVRLLAVLTDRLTKSGYGRTSRNDARQPTSSRNNMIYDPGPQQRHGDSGLR